MEFCCLCKLCSPNLIHFLFLCIAFLVCPSVRLSSVCVVSLSNRSAALYVSSPQRSFFTPEITNQFAFTVKTMVLSSLAYRAANALSASVQSYVATMSQSVSAATAAPSLGEAVVALRPILWLAAQALVAIGLWLLSLGLWKWCAPRSDIPYLGKRLPFLGAAFHVTSPLHSFVCTDLTSTVVTVVAPFSVWL